VTKEIDIVAGRADSATIWILEVKDPAPVFAPPEIRRHLNRFIFDAKSYAVILTQKAQELDGYGREIAKALGLPPSDYRTASAFVTREVVPAAFAQGPFAYFTLSSVVDDVRPAAEADDRSEAARL
jgi:hypothetical protein